MNLEGVPGFDLHQASTWHAMKAFRAGLAAMLLLPVPASDALAWRATAHAAVGVLAVEQASPQTRATLQDILGSVEPEFIARSCNWPDAYDQAVEGAWTEPLHYVNIPPGAIAYDEARDCPERRCLPAAVLDYARELGDASLSRNARQQAFAFLCHYTADLHQPLHVAYANDLGGNRVSVEFEGERLSLHSFWDQRLLDHLSPDWRQLTAVLAGRANQKVRFPWQPGEVEAWTNETHEMMKRFAYPATNRIDDEFAQQSWRVIQHQLDTAAARLAAILDTLLGGG